MDSALESIDKDLLVKINSLNSEFLDRLMWQLSEIYIVLPLGFLLVYFYYRRYQLKNTVSLLLCIGIVIACTDISSNMVKHAVKRARPTHNKELKDKLHLVNGYTGGKYGFFSSHAANTVGVTTFLFLAASWIRKRLRFLFFSIPLLIIYSRMYLGAHYPSDVFIGSIDGIIFGYVVFIIFRKHFFKSPLLTND